MNILGKITSTLEGIPVVGNFLGDMVKKKSASSVRNILIKSIRKIVQARRDLVKIYEHQQSNLVGVRLWL